jgi:two-component system NarL family sensor kinase
MCRQQAVEQLKGGWSVAGFLTERGADQVEQRPGLACEIWRLGEDAPDRRHRSVGTKRSAPGGREGDQDAPGEHVRSWPDLLPRPRVEAFGRHVPDRADHPIRSGELATRVDRVGDAEVDHLRHAEAEQDIGRFQILRSGLRPRDGQHGSWAWCVLAVMPAVFLVLPSGRLSARRLRPVLGAALAVAPVFAAGVAIAPRRLNEAPLIDNPLAVAAAGPVLEIGASILLVLFLGLLLVSLGSMAWRLRGAVGDERRQLAWVLLGAGVLALQLPFEALAAPTVSGITSALVITAFCASLGIAMVRHRLYEIDFILNRALVYGTLTICLLVLYAIVVALLGAALRDRTSFAASLVAAGVVAVVLAPLRTRLQRGVDRMLYGQRRDPLAVMSQLGRRLERAAPDEVLPALAEEVAATLKLPRVTIELSDGGAATHGTGGGEPLMLPLTFQGRQLGRLTVSARGPRETFSRAERELLDGIARQLGVAAFAVGLTADLQRSRERLVTAREEERRRLRRDLHDGLGPLLAGISLHIAAARNLLRGDPDPADRLLARLDQQTQSAVADVRRLVDDLRPPALDELGLVSAIREQAARFEGKLTVSVEVLGELGDLPAAVEVAAFRIATEAITNSVRHAGAQACHVYLSLDGALEVEIRDDGRGLPADVKPGVGLASIGERTAELGGTWSIGPCPGSGTVVTARLPIMKA